MMSQMAMSTFEIVSASSIFGWRQPWKSRVQMRSISSGFSPTSTCLRSPSTTEGVAAPGQKPVSPASVKTST